MTNDELIKQFLADGGKVTKVPEKNVRRSEFEAEKLKQRRLIKGLRERALALKNVAG